MYICNQSIHLTIYLSTYICTPVTDLLGREKITNSEKLGLSGILKIQRTYLRVKVRDLISLS